MRCVGVILKCCRPVIATAASISELNSTNAMPCLPGTMSTFMKPGNLRGGGKEREDENNEDDGETSR